MNRMIAKTLTVAAAACWVTVVGAQSSTMGEAGQEQGRSDKSKKAMKFTGCLQQGDTPNSYKLTDVQPAAGSMSGTSGSTSGSGTSGSGTTGSGTTGSGTTGSATSGGYGMGGSQDLELVPSGTKVDLEKHVGQRVEITGRTMMGTDDPTSGTSGTTGSGTTGSGMTGMGHDMKGKKVQVTAVRTVAGSCPTK